MAPCTHFYSAALLTVPAAYADAGVVLFKRDNTVPSGAPQAAVPAATAGTLVLHIRNTGGANGVDVRIVGIPTIDTPASQGVVIATEVTVAAGAVGMQVIDRTHWPFYLVQSQQDVGDTTVELKLAVKDSHGY